MRIQKSVVFAGLLFSSTVYAADHVMRVDEVLLEGGNGEQFIEFHDTSTESLPAGPYKLVVYNSAGTMTETVTLTGLTASASVYYVVGNVAAANTYSSVAPFGATLTMALPNPGQACFANAAGANLHCLAWGCNTSLVRAGTINSAVPTSGMTLSLDNSVVQFAIPTPEAANNAGTAAGTACATNPLPDAGVPDAGSGNPNNPDAGTGGGGGVEEDEGGCCQSTPRGGAGATFLSLLGLGLLLRRRSR